MPHTEVLPRPRAPRMGLRIAAVLLIALGAIAGTAATASAELRIDPRSDFSYVNTSPTDGQLQARPRCRIAIALLASLTVQRRRRTVMRCLHVITGARALGLLALLMVLGVAATSAWATPPGKNGPIVFRRYLDTGRTTGALFTMNPDGTQVKQITRPRRGVIDQGRVRGALPWRQRQAFLQVGSGAKCPVAGAGDHETTKR